MIPVLPSKDHLVSFHQLTILTGQSHISKVVSFLKFLIFQLCHSYWPNISSENMGSSTKTQPFTSHGFRKSESLGVQDSGSHNIENARKILHFDIFSFSCLNPSISEKKKKFIQNRHNHHRPNIQHNRALEKMNIQHNRALLKLFGYISSFKNYFESVTV